MARRNASAPVFVELKKKHEGIVYKRRIGGKRVSGTVAHGGRAL